MESNPTNQSERPGFINVGEKDFESVVLASREPVLVTFWAPWSNACKSADCLLDALVTRYAGKVKIARVNADENPLLGMWYEVQFVPTLLVFIGATLRLRLYGTMSIEAMMEKLEPLIGPGNPETQPTA